MRGKALAPPVRAAAQRITPAHAGKSEHYSNDPDRLKDHPRACGEKAMPTAAAGGRRGSPPRMRGKGGDLSGRVSPARITPAHAGKR